MTIVCLDMEGVLVPEIWVTFAEKVGISEFKRTTRDEPNYDTLMQYRIDLLKRHKLTYEKVLAVIESITPFHGALDFLNRLREKTQVVIVSDTFDLFSKPIMRKLGWPTIFQNKLVVDSDGYISAYKLRSAHTKLDTVRGLQSCGGVSTIAAGDSYNDIEMITASKSGFLFRAPERIISEYPEIKSYVEYNDLYNAIIDVLD